MPVLVDPISPADLRILRAAVLAAAAGRVRRVTPILRVGIPSGPALALAEDPAWDHGLRTEMVGAALRAAGDPPWVWLTRTGPLALQDVDAAWMASALTAAAERDVDIAFVVVTRHGWTDPRSGARREWKRIRGRSEPLAQSQV